MGGVLGELGLEGLEGGEAALVTEAAQEGEGEGAAVEVAGEVQEMSLNGFRGRGAAVNGGAVTDVDDGAIAFAGVKPGIGGIYTRAGHRRCGAHL